MMNRRQVLRSLAAATLAAIAPIPVMGAAIPRIPQIGDVHPSGPCGCCDDAIESYNVTIYTSPGRVYELPLLPDGSYGAVFEDVGEIRVTGISDAFEKFKSRTDFQGVSLCTPYHAETIRVGD